jgi:membrane associated rhomboid family serine protease
MMPEPPVSPGPGPIPETCFHHHDRVTGRHCTRCGRPACAECLHTATVGSQCWECIKAERPPTRERVRRSLAARPAVATQALIGLNVAMFLFTNGLNDTFGNTRLFHYAQTALYVDQGQSWRLVTAGFIHFGIAHIAFNMFALYLIGNALEPAVGPWRFTAIYFASLLAGSLGAMVLDPLVYSGGASGAVFGVGAAATVLMVRRGVRFWDTGFGPLLLINLAFGFFLANVSIGAHVGGMIGGGICAAAMVQAGKSRLGVAAGYAVPFLVAAISFVLAIAIAHAKVA